MLQLQRSVYYYRHRRDPQTELRVRLRDLAAARVRYGYERLHTLLRREGWQINHKRVYRLYHEEGLSLRLKTKTKRLSQRGWVTIPGPPKKFGYQRLHI